MKTNHVDDDDLLRQFENLPKLGPAGRLEAVRLAANSVIGWLEEIKQQAWYEADCLSNYPEVLEYVANFFRDFEHLSRLFDDIGETLTDVHDDVVSIGGVSAGSWVKMLCRYICEPVALKFISYKTSPNADYHQKYWEDFLAPMFAEPRPGDNHRKLLVANVDLDLLNTLIYKEIEAAKKGLPPMPMPYNPILMQLMADKEVQCHEDESKLPGESKTNLETPTDKTSSETIPFERQVRMTYVEAARRLGYVTGKGTKAQRENRASKKVQLEVKKKLLRCITASGGGKIHIFDSSQFPETKLQ